VEPQTIARETAQNENWNRNLASGVALESPITGKASAGFPENCRKKPFEPISASEMPSTSALPNAKAKPTAQ
jgi:hypothetical protein